jgi:hypothetical protein
LPVNHESCNSVVRVRQVRVWTMVRKSVGFGSLNRVHSERRHNHRGCRSGGNGQSECHGYATWTIGGVDGAGLIVNHERVFVDEAHQRLEPGAHGSADRSGIRSALEIQLGSEGRRDLHFRKFQGGSGCHKDNPYRRQSSSIRYRSRVSVQMAERPRPLISTVASLVQADMDGFFSRSKIELLDHLRQFRVKSAASFVPCDNSVSVGTPSAPFVATQSWKSALGERPEPGPGGRRASSRTTPPQYPK